MMDIGRTLEALLFVSDAPVTAKTLATAMGCPEFEVEDTLEKYGTHLRHGYCIATCKNCRRLSTMHQARIR